MNDFMIGDHNYRNFVNQTLNGKLLCRGAVPRDFNQHPVGSSESSQKFEETMPLIPRHDWPERCKEMEANQSRLSDIRNIGNFGQQIPALDQDGQGFCWFYSPTACIQLLRALANEPFVQLSPHAGACKIFDFRDPWGVGALAFDFLVENGVPSYEYWPQKSMSRQYDNPETWANAKNYRIAEGWIDLDVPHPADADMTFDQVATCLLSLIPVVCDFNWWGHSVCGMDLVDLKPQLGPMGLDDPKRWGIRILNSWTNDWGVDGTAVLEGRKAIPDGGCAPRAVTTSQPA